MDAGSDSQCFSDYLTHGSDSVPSTFCIPSTGDKKRSRTKLNEVDESDYKVLQSMNGFSAARRIKVINLDAATTKENVLSTAAKEFRVGMPFILRPKRGKGFFKIMDVSWKLCCCCGIGR